MPPNQFLVVGAGDGFRPAESCEVFSVKYGGGEWMAHHGDPNSFLVADVLVKDGSARVRVALWKCVFCGAVLVGLNSPEGDEEGLEFTWLERAEESSG